MGLVFLLDFFKDQPKPFPRLFFANLSRPFKPASIVQDTPNEVGVDPLAKQDMHRVSSYILCTDMWQLEEWMVRPGVCQLLSMRPHMAAGLFQIQLFHAFLWVTPRKVFTIAFPAWVVAGSMGEFQYI